MIKGGNDIATKRSMNVCIYEEVIYTAFKKIQETAR